MPHVYQNIHLCFPTYTCTYGSMLAFTYAVHSLGQATFSLMPYVVDTVVRYITVMSRHREQVAHQQSKRSARGAPHLERICAHINNAAVDCR